MRTQSGRRSRRLLSRGSSLSFSFLYSNEKESEDPRESNRRDRRPDCVRMQEAQAETERERDRRVDGKLAQTYGSVAQAQTQVEAGSIEIADENEAVDSRIEQKNLVKDGQVGWPRALEPAQIHRETQRSQNQEIHPGAVLSFI